MAKRPAEVIRFERDGVATKIEALRKQQKALSDELRDVEGPIPDRSHRGSGTTFSIKKAAK
jgi:hypothetical protein